jgi:excisionase family DNA binding protein
VGEDRTEAHSGGSLTERLTISQAAALLGVHKNTVRNRIKDGTYEAETIVTERGPTYYIKRESILDNLPTNTLSSASQELVSPQAMEFVQELLRPFVSELGQVREQLGAERVRREMAEERAATSEERAAALEAELEAMRATPDPLQASEPADDEQQGRGPAPDAEGAHEATESPFTEVEPEEPRRRSWWRAFFGFE